MAEAGGGQQAAGGGGVPMDSLILLQNNIAASQIKRMAEISKWTYFTRRKGLSLSAAVLACFGIVFLLCYFLMSDANSNVQEYKVDYTTDDDIRSSGDAIFEGSRTGTEAYETYRRIQRPIRWGSFIINVENEIKGPTYFQYVLDGFYQNHMWYMRSVDEDQLRYPPEDSNHPTRQDMENSFCRRLTYVSEVDNRILYPCGLVAKTTFNDTFYLEIDENSDGNWAYLSMNTESPQISWKTDYENNHQNPEANYKLGPSSPQYPVPVDELDFWLLEFFPPVSCDPDTVALGRNSQGLPEWVPLHVAIQKQQKDAGSPIFEAFDCRGGWTNNAADATCYFATTRRNETGQTCAALGGRENRHEYWGLESGRFVNWMRTAGLPIFRKLYAKIDRTIPAGSKIRVNFIDNWEAPGVKKAVLLGNVSWLGGRNEFTQYFSLIASIGAFFFSVVLLSLQVKKQAQTEGGVKVLQWS